MTTASYQASGTPRLDIIEIVKGFAITCVVAAHLIKFGTLEVPQWYAVFKQKIYLFHMPLFMVMSGYVFFKASYQERALLSFRTFVTQRCDRLLTPFFGVALLVLSAKTAAARLMYVDAAPESFLTGAIQVFWGTDDSPVFTIWYLWVLCILSILTPLLWKAATRKIELLLLGACALYFFRPPDIFYANRICEFMIFFMAGGFAAKIKFLEKSFPASIIFFVTLAFGASLWAFDERGAGLLTCGLLGSMAAPMILKRMPQAIQSALKFLGEHSMAIYLLNVFAIGAAKGIYLKAFGYTSHDFYTLSIILFIAGLLAPILSLKIIKKSGATSLAKYLS